MKEEIKEYIIAKRTPISSCVDLSKYFIGRHKVLPLYLTPQFEREFNSKMCQLEQLKEQLQQKEDIINKANTYVIENANIYLNIMGNKVGFFKENDGKTPIELLEILDNKGE